MLNAWSAFCPDGACAEENPYSTRLRIQTFGVAFFQNQSTTMFILMFVCLFRLVKELTLTANVIIVVALMQTNSFLNLHNLTQIFNNTAYCL